MCNRCGYTMNPDGVGNCQKCGAPLSSKVEGGFNPRMGAQEQPELPAWLESLRVGDRPGAPASSPNSPSNPGKFSTADLIDEGTLPSWMRSGRADASEKFPSNPNNSLRPSAEALPPRGFNAQSLIDEQSLPSWMQGEKSATSSQPQRGIDASSLIQQDAVPDWMKSISETASPNATGATRLNSAPSYPASPAQSAPPIQPISPAQSMPNAQPMSPVQSMPNIQPSSSLAPTASAPLKNLSPRDLIDESALPAWMSQQSSGTPSSQVQAPVGAPIQPGSLSPSSLLDMNSLPEWLREGAQEPQRGSPSSIQAPRPAYAAPTSPAIQEQPLISAPANYAATGGKVAASSFVDTSALPEWLRSAASQGQMPPQGQGAPMPPQRPTGNPPPAPYVAPSRVENVRVPNRPRSELASSESSEVAANVFASMLGVASAAPNFPSQADPAGSYGPPNSVQQSAPPANVMPGYMSGTYSASGQLPPQGPPAGYNNGPAGYNNGPSYNNGGPPPPAYSGYPNGGTQGNYSSLGVPAPAAAPPANGGKPMPGASEVASKEKSTKKRGGLVQALHDWLFP